MILSDFHTHTSFCDGDNTAEEMAEAAARRGMTALGFSGHSHTPMDESWCMSPEGTESYKAEVRRLREKYRGRLSIFLGIEQDFFADLPTDDYDYVIGSVHYIRLGESYVPVDELPELTWEPGLALTGGDPYTLCEAYFDEVSRVAEVTGCDIIGHFDLISKYNERFRIFDESHPRFVRAWQKAADALLKTGKIFEINTSPLTKGYRSRPYPSPEMIDYISARGGRFILSSDSHTPESLCGCFAEWEKYAEPFVPGKVRKR